MSTPTYAKAVYTLQGEGLSVTYSPSEGTLDIRGRTGDDRINGLINGQRHFAGQDLTTTKDDFITFATACLLESDRAGIGFFMTIAVPNGIATLGATEVEGVAISTRRKWDDNFDLSQGARWVGWSVQPLKGTVAFAK
jgi:hypothetical protein